MAQVYPVAGSKFFIGGAVAQKSTVTAADFAGQTWTEVKGWANAGTLGDTQNVGTQSLIDDAREQQFKTTRSGGMFENTWVPIANDPGQLAMKAAAERCGNYAWKVEWGANCAPAADVEISVATPAVVTWPGHGLEAGNPVVFDSTGTLPTGLVAGNVYYVSATGLTDDAFSVSATVGGGAIATTAAGTGIASVTAPPVGQTDLFYGMAMTGSRSGGDATAANLRTMSVAVTSNIVEV